MKKILITVLAFLFLTFAQKAQAEGVVLGVHILRPQEISQAKDLFYDSEKPEQWHYVTIPLSLDDLNKKEEWEQFFIDAKKYRVIPLVRLVTRFENGAWQIPSRKEITSYFTFLNQFEWPTAEKHIIVFNEVNHAAEWGNSLDPEGYAEVLRFTSDWAHSEENGYVILPAAMDLAAPNGKKTQEAFRYLEQMYQSDAEIFDKIDFWNSHSYPNPGFSSSPTRTAQNSVRGFQHELAYLKKKTEKNFEVFITETGWVNTSVTTRWLSSYYSYALQHVWSHPQVKGVTFFVLKGDPGPFSEFGFLDKNDQPTAHYFAIRKAIESVKKPS